MKIITVLAVFLAAATLAFAQQPSNNDKAQKIDEFLMQYHKVKDFDGAVLVAENGYVIYKKGFGLANREWQIPNAVDTKFRVASITKQFTSLLIFQLIQENKLRLDGKISEYLPDFRKDVGDKITVHQLLTHTSGLYNWESKGEFAEKSKNRYAKDLFVKNFLSGDLEFEPGTKFGYNNGDYFLLGLIIEKITGKSWEENLRERILQPLGMKNSGVDAHGEILPKMARGYVKENGKFVVEPYLDLQIYYSAGAMYSTLEDLLVWHSAFYNEKLLSKELWDKMFTSLKDKGYVASGSWTYNRPFGERKPFLIERRGFAQGFRINTVRTDDKHSVIVLSNNGSNDVDAISSSLLSLLYNQAVETPK
jgi:CubicO group peptidase (beta-lactamase class C family)